MTKFTVLTCICVALIGAVATPPVLAAPAGGDAKRAERRQKVLEKFDSNGNGQLDPDERRAAKAAAQKRRDQAGEKGADGNAAQDPERRKKLLAKFDKDGDGALSEAERTAAKEARAKRDR
jgi:Ca2+-binding EF-hand superfamily protein